MSTQKVDIWVEMTPNPHTLKFNVSKPLVDSGTINFTDKGKAKGSPLAEGIFEIENVLGVMIGPGFVTVTKAPAAEWQTLAESLTNKIRSILSAGENFVSKDAQATSHASGGNSDVERRIKEILDNEIRPAVAMDGGDITFYGFENGVVTLHLQGSCSSCPSSIMTLKMGVENRLKSLIPEVKEVIQV